jgi:hypothetical protein
MKSILVVLIKAAQQMEANGAFDEVADTNTAKREYVIKQAKVEFEKVGLTFDEQTIETTLEGLLKDANLGFYDISHSVKFNIVFFIP